MNFFYLLKIFIVFSLLIISCYSLKTLNPSYQVNDLQSTPNGLRALLKKTSGNGPYGDDLNELILQVFFETPQRVHVKITDRNQSRWEVPSSVIRNQTPTTKPPTMNYKVEIKDPFGIVVTRLNDNSVIFDSSTEPFVYSKYFLTIGSSLPDENPNFYGLGERVHNFRLDPSNKRYVMFNRDQANVDFKNLYSTHPFYVEKRGSTAHGIFFFNSNAQDVIVKPYAMQYRTIGGILDFFIFTGPTPDQVVKQYHEVIGRPVLPSYWALGFHHCRWGYKSVDVVKDVVKNYAQHQIPLDTMWIDIDYMDKYKLFTYDPGNYPISKMREFVAELHRDGKHYVPIVDPGVKLEPQYDVYEEGMRQGLFIKKADGVTPLVNKVWPGLTFFPDFMMPRTSQYWAHFVKRFHDMAQFDGLWLDMNEIVGFCDGECISTGQKIHDGKLKVFDPNNPPYQPTDDKLYKTTLWMDAKTNFSIEYDTHSLYSHFENVATKEALNGLLKKRSLIITRSSFAGTGYYSSKWLGDNDSSWKHLFLSISSILSFQLYGIPFIGGDICGFNGDTTSELCTRWHQLGIFYPFARNHNAIQSRPQEPWTFDETLLVEARRAIVHRYTLIPFFYTQLMEISMNGGGMFWKAMAFAFPNDNSKDINFLDRQFAVGADNVLLVAPVLEQGATSVNVYFPMGTIWYDYYTGLEMKGVDGKWVTLPANISHIPVHVRGGTMVPKTVRPGLTTRESLKSPYNLLIALDNAFHATGKLYLDDGESLDSIDAKKYTLIDFNVEPLGNGQKLNSTLVHNGFDIREKSLESLTVYGASNACKVQVDGQDTRSFTFNTDTEVLQIFQQQISLAKAFNIEWTCD